MSPMHFTGDQCAKAACVRPLYRDGLCARCWQLARMFGRLAS